MRDRHLWLGTAFVALLAGFAAPAHAQYIRDYKASDKPSVEVDMGALDDTVEQQYNDQHNVTQEPLPITQPQQDNAPAPVAEEQSAPPPPQKKRLLKPVFTAHDETPPAPAPAPVPMPPPAPPETAQEEPMPPPAPVEHHYVPSHSAIDDVPPQQAAAAVEAPVQAPAPMKHHAYKPYLTTPVHVAKAPAPAPAPVAAEEVPAPVTSTEVAEAVPPLPQHKPGLPKPVLPEQTLPPLMQVAHEHAPIISQPPSMPPAVIPQRAPSSVAQAPVSMPAEPPATVEPLPEAATPPAPEAAQPVAKQQDKPLPDVTAPVEQSEPQTAAAPPAPETAPAAPPVADAAAPTPPADADKSMPAVPALADLTLDFSGNSSDLTAASQKKLDGIIHQMADTIDGRLQVRGYASGEDGSQSSARRIALSRALSVRSYLMDKGIKPTRVDVRALGSETDRSPVDRVDLIFAK